MDTLRTIEEIERTEEEEKAIDFVDALTERCTDTGNSELRDICQKLQAMTPEDKAGFMHDFIAELPKEREYRKLKKLLHHQPVPLAEFEIMSYYAKRLKAEDIKNFDFWLMLDLFHYGRICGIRAERARRKVSND